MAYNRDIVAADKVFFDTDRKLRFTLYAGEPTDAQIAAGTAVIQDATGMALIWVLKKTTKSATALISKTSGSGIALTGVFNASPAINTQRVEVTLSDKDTYSPNANPPINIKPGPYFHALKRTDTGAETILCWGAFLLQQAAAWEAT